MQTASNSSTMDSQRAKVAWSYTALTAFETCPRRYYLTRVSKEVQESTSEAQAWGTTVHEALERRLKHGEPLPPALEEYESVARKIESGPGELIVEQKLAVDSAWAPTDWVSSDAWCRGIVDVARLHKSSALVLDYKTGKRKPDSDQLRLFALLIMSHYPAIDKVTTAFLWMKEGKTDSAVFTRHNIPWLRGEFNSRVRRLELAYESNRWPVRPSGLCRAWCPVGRSRCEFCGQP